MKSPKTTISGILSFVIATATTLTAFLAAQAVANPSQTKLYAEITAGCTLAAALGKVYLGLISKDADQVTQTDVSAATLKAEQVKK